MSHTINFIAGLLTASRNLHECGRDTAALDLLQRLAGFRQLAPAVAEEVHSRLADLYAGRQEFKKARRHLAIVLTFQPQEGAYHHRMAVWIEVDPDAARERAGQYYDRAVRCDPDNADFWADYGAYLLGEGRTTAGCKALRRAFDLASHDPDLVGQVVADLRDAGFWDEARKLLRRAMFEHSHDRRFRALWQQQQFERLCAEQQPHGDASRKPAHGAPMLLPFRAAARPSPTLHVDGKIIRFDSAAEVGETALPLPKRRAKNNPRNRRTK